MIYDNKKQSESYKSQIITDIDHLITSAIDFFKIKDVELSCDHTKTVEHVRKVLLGNDYEAVDIPSTNYVSYMVTTHVLTMRVKHTVVEREELEFPAIRFAILDSINAIPEVLNQNQYITQIFANAPDTCRFDLELITCDILFADPGQTCPDFVHSTPKSMFSFAWSNPLLSPSCPPGPSPPAPGPRPQ